MTTANFISVCEKIYLDNNDLREDFVDCLRVPDEACRFDQGEKICITVMKRKCKVKQRDVIPKPKVVCDSKPVKVCGRETCPLVKKTTRCETVTKHVSLSHSHARWEVFVTRWLLIRHRPDTFLDVRIFTLHFFKLIFFFGDIFTDFFYS